MSDDRPMTLTAADIVAADDLDRELVHVPEWGGAVWVYALNGRERGQYMQAVVDVDKNTGKASPVIGKAELVLVALSVKDDDGRRLFPDGDGMAQLAGKSARVIARLHAVANRLSGLAVDSVEVAEGN